MRNYLLLSTGFSLALMAAGCQTATNPPRATIPSQSASADDLPRDRAAEACLVTARELDRNGYASEAINEYERARELDPSLTSISRRLAVLYDRQGNDSKALEEYQAAVTESAEDADVLNDFGYFYVSRNNGPEAEQWLRRAVIKDPKSARAWVNLGTALAEQRKYPESYDAFARVLPPAQALSNLGILEGQQGDYKLAVQSLTLANKADPSLPQTLAALQWAQKKLASANAEPRN